MPKRSFLMIENDLASNHGKRFYIEIMLFCLVLGEDVQRRFEAPTNMQMTVSGLQKVIKDLKQNYLSGVDPDGLDLWKVMIPTKDENDNKWKILKNKPHDQINIEEDLEGKLLQSDDVIEELFNGQPPAKHIHIIVEPYKPATTDQGHTYVSRVIENLGYLPRQGGIGGTMLPTDLEVRSANKGVNLNNPDTSLRFDIINPLIKELINKKVILVRAPPFAGKTSITQILEHFLVSAPEYSNYRVIRISLIWRGGITYDNFGEMWAEIVGVTWKEWTRQCSKIPSILIVDEAQLIYSDKGITGNNEKTADQFWMVIKGLLQEITGINIIMFAAYGYRSSGLSTPFKLPGEHCKSLVDINFSSRELRTYVDKFCSIYFNLDQQSILELYKYIQAATEGHAGLVHHILISIENGNKKEIDNNCLTWKSIFKYLNSKDFDSSIYINCRAVPDVSSLKKNEKRLKLCEDTYLKGKVPYSIYNPDPDASYLVKTGVLTVVDDTYLTFAAPLLKRSFFQQNYGVENSIDITPIDLHHFIVKIFTAMCNELSGKILRETLGFGSDRRILEQTWQKEFYRIGTRVLGSDHFLSCDVGSVFGCEGKVDFYVSGLDWAIELLRDGENMKEHKARFDPLRGKYKEIIKYSKNIAIIDIRSIGIIDTHSEAKNVRKMEKNFIYVSCSKDFDAFKIESLGKETVTIDFKN